MYANYEKVPGRNLEITRKVLGKYWENANKVLGKDRESTMKVLANTGKLRERTEKVLGK